MRRIVPILIVCVALFSLPHSARASATETSFSLTCSSFTATGTTNQSYLGVEAKGSSFEVFQGFPTSGGVATGTVTFPHQPDGTLIIIYVYGATDSYGTWDFQSYFVEEIPCHEAGSVTWFNPGDGRIDGQPGDRIAVWCNATATPPNIVVYGVGDNATNGSHGFWLATFNNADLLKAGKGGITKNAGAGNGTISAMQDGNGNFYVAWNGGIFHATGKGDFAKSFACSF